MDITKRQFAINSAWKILESFSGKGLSMIVSIVLARLLSPSDYGLLALTMIFTNFSDMLIDGGFSTALIRKESVDDYDYSAVFSISSTMSVILYVILFFFAPKVAEYYSSPQLTSVLRVMGLVFFIQAFTAVRNGIINRNMQFKLLCYCNIAAAITSGIAGIFFAYIGFGVWALVIHRLTQYLVLTALLFMNVKWKIKWRFNWVRIKNILSFSLSLLGSSVVGYIGGSITGIIIGKKYSIVDLGYYDKGEQLPRQFSLYTFGAMSSVLLPTISSYQNDLEKMKNIIRHVARMTAFLIIPMMFGLVLTSREFICVLFTKKWLYSLHCMQVFSLSYIISVFGLIDTQIILALGYSNLRLKLEIIKIIITLPILLIFVSCFNLSLTFFAIFGAIIGFLMFIIAHTYVRKLIGYKFLEIFQDISKPLAASTVMAVILLIFQSFISINSMLISLIVKIFIGVVSYFMMVKVMKIQELEDFALFKRRK